MIKKNSEPFAHIKIICKAKKQNKDEIGEQKHSRCRKSNGIRNSIQSEPFQEGTENEENSEASTSMPPTQFIHFKRCVVVTSTMNEIQAMRCRHEQDE